MTRAELIAAMDAAGVEDDDDLLLDIPDWDEMYGTPYKVETDGHGNTVIFIR